MTDGPARRPEHSDSMSDESARLKAQLEAGPIFAALGRVELARLVGALEETHLAAREVIFKEGGESAGLSIDAAGDLFGQRQAMLAGIVLTVLTVIGLAVSIPYWHMLGILAP
jgi:hypothetical protein